MVLGTLSELIPHRKRLPARRSGALKGPNAIVDVPNVLWTVVLADKALATPVTSERLAVGVRLSDNTGCSSCRSREARATTRDGAVAFLGTTWRHCNHASAGSLSLGFMFGVIQIL